MPLPNVVIAKNLGLVHACRKLTKHPKELRRSPHEWMPWSYQTAVKEAEAATARVLTSN